VSQLLADKLYAHDCYTRGRQNSVSQLLADKLMYGAMLNAEQYCLCIEISLTSHKHGTGGLHSSTGLGLLPLFEISKAACLDVQVPHETDVVLLALEGPTSHCAII
jgi:hypothetical protein